MKTPKKNSDPSWAVRLTTPPTNARAMFLGIYFSSNITFFPSTSLLRASPHLTVEVWCLIEILRRTKDGRKKKTFKHEFPRHFNFFIFIHIKQKPVDESYFLFDLKYGMISKSTRNLSKKLLRKHELENEVSVHNFSIHLETFLSTVGGL